MPITKSSNEKVAPRAQNMVQIAPCFALLRLFIDFRTHKNIIKEI